LGHAVEAGLIASFRAHVNIASLLTYLVPALYKGKSMGIFDCQNSVTLQRID